MIRATLGTWTNYATTAAFQVLFAARFGATAQASAYVIVFGMCMAVAGLLTSSLQTVGVPRLVDGQGRLRSGSVTLLVGALVVGLAAALATAACGQYAADLIADAGHLDRNVIRSLFVWGGMTLALQVCAGVLSSVGIALGRRLVPTVAPAIPSTLCSLYLLLGHDPSTVPLLALFGITSALEVAFLAVSIIPKVRIADGQAPPAGLATVATVASLALLSLLPPFERVAAGWGAADGAARYDYAIRSLAVGQQLILGGVVVAAFADWSSLASRARAEEIAAGLRRVVITGGMVLLLAAIVGAVARTDLVRVAFQRGTFSGSDTAGVAVILKWAVLGFWAEGVGLLIVPALAGVRWNVPLAGVAVLHFAIQVILILLLAPRLGPSGVAIAYSLTHVALLAPLALLARRAGVWTGMAGPAARAALVAGVTLMASAALSAVTPTIVSVIGVAVVFALLLAVVRPLALAKVAK